MTERILYCVFSRFLYLDFVTMLILDSTALCISYPGGPTNVVHEFRIGVTGVVEPKTALRCSVLWTALTPRV